MVAVNDGRIVATGHSRRLGNFVTLQDVYGNTYTYGHLKSVAESFPTPKPRAVDDKAVRRELKLPPRDAAPDTPGVRHDEVRRQGAQAGQGEGQEEGVGAREGAPHARAGDAAPAKERLFANPDRPNSAAAGGDQQEYALSEDFGAYLNRVFGLDRSDVDMKPLKRGARVTAGTVLGRIGKISKRTAPHLLFEIRPAGRGAPRIDPKPILDGWKLLESTAIYRAANRNPFHGKDAQTPSIGQILLMSKEALSRARAGQPERRRSTAAAARTSAAARSTAGCSRRSSSSSPPGSSRPSPRCAAATPIYTASGNVSEHTTGTAVDIAAINGMPIMGHQGQGSITELAVQRLLTLQGTMKPHQIISLMEFQGVDNTIAMADHADHIHVGFRPLYGANAKTAKQVDAILKPEQWIKLIDRLDEIDNPTVRAQALEVRGRGRPARQPGPQGRVARPGTSASSSGSWPGGWDRIPAATSCGATRATRPSRSLVIGGLAAPRRARFGGAAARARRSPARVPVEVTRATVIAAATLDGEARAEAWLGEACGPAADATVDGGARGAQPRAARAPRRGRRPVRERGRAPRDALVTRVGYGTGEEVSDGALDRGARAGRRRRRSSRARPRCGRRSASPRCSRRGTSTLAAELLALRARLDLDHGRDREAALQLEAALAAARERAGGLARAARDAGAAGRAARRSRRRGRRRRPPRGPASSTRPGATRSAPRSAALEAALRARTARAPF